MSRAHSESPNRGKKQAKTKRYAHTEESTSALAKEVLAEGSYAERTIWSVRFKAWARFSVKKPRLPNESDKPKWIEQSRFRPTSFSAVTGSHNTTTIRALQNFVGNFESLKSLQDLTIIYGPSGSGKSMLAQLYTDELSESMGLSPASFSKWCLTVNGADYEDTQINDMVVKIQKFVEPKLEKAVTVAFRVLILDNLDQVSHSNQTTLKGLMDKNLMKLKWVVTCCSVKGLVGSMQSKGLLVQTKGAGEKDCLLIVLGILQRSKVGFERQALRRLFDLHRPELSLSKMISTLQAAFLRFHFISEENINRVMGAKASKVPVSPLAVLGEGYQKRCRICTLPPPCKHNTQDQLLQRAEVVRAGLRRRLGEPKCPSFMHSGCCSVFLKYGRCSYDHPTDRHAIHVARRVCPQCTVVWPCNHCTYSQDRRRLLKLVDVINRRLDLLKEMHQPDPPAYLIRKIVDEHEDWKDRVEGLHRFYVTQEKEAVKSEVVRWINTAYSADVKEYRRQQEALLKAYGEVVKSPLLVEPTFSRQHSRGGDRGRDRGGGEVGWDDDSSLGSLISYDSEARGRAKGKAKGDGSVSPPPRD